MPYIVGTAGHIDHGKTSLIKALTGIDTDRLKEEKERGISIDLGFAHLDLADGTQAGIVDVPGHERFIRNMLAGAHGIDLVLFTVAADDGVMPQTEEHLDILHLLGVKLAIFLITKADLVSPSRIQEVEEEIKILTLGTALEEAPIIPFSAVTGQGLEALRERISRMLRECEKPAPGGYFRLPIDRAFVLQGHGVVVTGTALSGEIKVGDRVRCLPGGQTFRVRSLQVHNRAVEVGGWGQRIALNLTGQERASIERGQVICHEKLTLTSQRFDALLEVRPAAAKGIKNHQRIRIHLGTAERMAKLILLGRKEKTEPKETTYCQIGLTEPVLVMRGDHFIVRDETAQRTLGGGIVLHPWAKKHKRSETDLEKRLEGLHNADVPALIEGIINESDDFALPYDPIQQFLNLRDEQVRGALENMTTLRAVSSEGEQLYTTETKWERVKEEMLRALHAFHRDHPLAPGMDMEELRVKLPFAMNPRLFRALVDVLTGQSILARDGNLLSAPGHQVRPGEEVRRLMERIRRLLEASALAPPDLRQIEKDLGVEHAKLAEVVRLMERDRAIVRAATDLYFLRDHVDKVKGVLYKYLANNSEITAATLRDLLGSSRKYTIALLEYFDREGVTVRVGDARRLKTPLSPGRQGVPR
ncbi:MAG: selenocysteine-specific translation elongation factor [Deltaproteobacteria bacterium]|nr:selenocysteine-specific translation elongation factor [Deltaproteobacteria bacterium]